MSTELARAPQPAFRPLEIQHHVIESKLIPQRFTIKVSLPIRRADNSERFPVLYTTDSDEFFGGLSTLTSELQLVGESARFILVGIGYDNPHDADLLRMRDLFPGEIRAHFNRVIEQLAQSPLSTGNHSVEAITKASGAHEFLRFIREELMPFIEARFPVAPNDNNYYGYSAGGTFGLYALFTRPDTFKRYILGSPATSYNGHHFGIELAQAFIETRRALQAQVYMTAGELEEFYGRFDLVSGYYLMAKFLKEAAIPGLDLKVRLFPEQTHATSWALAFSYGMKALFGPADSTPWWPDFDAS